MCKGICDSKFGYGDIYIGHMTAVNNDGGLRLHNTA